MKNRIITYILLGVLGVLPLTSCSDYLDKMPDDQLTLENVFSNRGNLERWLSYLYSVMPEFYIYDGPDAIGDELAPSVGWESQGFKAIQYQNGNWTPISPGVVTYWDKYPKAIRQAYTLIKYAHPLSDVSEKEINYMKAECRFFIAYYHAMMAMTYGAVPIIREAAVELSGESLLLKQEPFDVVVDWAANELLEASRQLPASYDEANKYGRITSLICLAMRACLLTFAASDLVNPSPGKDMDPEMQAMTNVDGVKIFNSTFNENHWKRAKDANKLLIEEAEKAGHALYKEYLSDGVTIDPFLSYQNMMMLRYKEGNTEIIFPRTKDNAGWFDDQALPRGAGGSGSLGVTQLLVDDFFMKDGKMPILGYNNSGETQTAIVDLESGYSETGYSTEDDVRATNWHYAVAGSKASGDRHVVAPKNTFNMYCNREPRFYISVVYNEQYHWGKGKATNFFFNGEDGQPSHDNPSAGYLIRKHVDPTFVHSTNTGSYKSRQGILYRLAEAYLSYAESALEYSIAKGTYDADKTDIVKYIDKIRERAGIPQYAAGEKKLGIPTDPEEMRKLIRRERRVEMNCEGGLRWFDLRRWKEAENVLNGNFYGMNMLAEKGNRDEFYKRVRYQTRKFKIYWWPIPQDEIDKNPNLKQMPGWMN